MLADAIPESGRDDEDSESTRDGFAGTCETTLIDWIQLVQMGRRDAIVTIHTYDGKEGTLWCREGDIIDADCDGIVGEDAVFRALSWRGGRVSVDFRAVVGEGQIQTTTAGLLLKAAYRRDSGIHEIVNQPEVPAQDAPLEALDFSDTTEVVDPSEILARHQHEHPFELLLEPEHELEPEGERQYGPQRPTPRPISVGFVIAGGLSTVLLFALFAWMWMDPLGSRNQVVSASIPATALTTGAATAPRGVPARPVADTSIPQPAPSPVAAARAVPRPAPATSSPASGATARPRATMALIRHATASWPIAWPSEGTRPSARARVEVIRERQPRVQIIDETAARERPHAPSIQIIDERRPRIEGVE